MVTNNGSVCVTKNNHTSAQSVQNHMLYTEICVLTARFFCHAGQKSFAVCALLLATLSVTLLMPHGVDVTEWDTVVGHVSAN